MLIDIDIVSICKQLEIYAKDIALFETMLEINIFYFKEDEPLRNVLSVFQEYRAHMYIVIFDWIIEGCLIVDK